MQRREFVRHWFWRFGIALVLVGILVYTFFHIFSGTSASLVTTPVKTITDTQILRGTAYLFRDETVLTVEEPGVVDDVSLSGSKVGQGRELLRVYGASEEMQTELQTELDRLNRLETLLEDSRVPAGEGLSAATGYRNQANATFLAIRRALQKGELSEIGALENEMLLLFNRYRTLISSSKSVDAALETVREAKAALLTGSVRSVYNEQSSGYFYNRTTVDGYEALFTAAAAEALTAESLASLVSASPQPTEVGFPVGKMAYGYKWYLAVTFVGGGDLFLPGTTYSVAFPENHGRVLMLSCERILAGANGETVVLLRSDVTPSDFAYLRSQTVEITAATTEGYYVPTAALVRENGVEGVYVFEGSTVSFRKISVLLRGDGYVIADRTVTGGEYLALNDILVVSGKNLYDGKVYR